MAVSRKQHLLALARSPLIFECFGYGVRHFFKRPLLLTLILHSHEQLFFQLRDVLLSGLDHLQMFPI